MRTEEEIKDRLFAVRCKIFKTGGTDSLEIKKEILEWVLSSQVEDIITSDIDISEKSKKIYAMFDDVNRLQRKIEQLETRINQTKDEIEEQTEYIIEQIKNEKE